MPKASRIRGRWTRQTGPSTLGSSGSDLIEPESVQVPHCEVSHEFESGAWDALAGEFGGSVFHTHRWVESQCLAYGGRPLFVRWLDDTGRDVAVAAGVQRPDPEGLVGRFASVVRFDSPPAARGLRADFAGSVLEWARPRSVVEVRFGSYDGVERHWAESLARPTARLEFPVRPAPSSELRRRMRKRTRSYINRAQRNGIRVQLSADRAEIAAFVTLHAATLARLKRRKGDVVSYRIDPTRHIAWLERMIQGGRANLYLAFDGSRPIAGCVFGVFGRSAYYWLNGASERALEVRATPLVLWHALSELSDTGYRRLSLGGVPAGAREPSSPDHGLYWFKLGFGADPTPCTSGASTLKPIRLAVIRIAQRVLRAATA
jgi:GNAT acetyltransferase-like protein